jgi:hypothetical protein
MLAKVTIMSWRFWGRRKDRTSEATRRTHPRVSRPADFMRRPVIEPLEDRFLMSHAVQPIIMRPPIQFHPPAGSTSPSLFLSRYSPQEIRHAYGFDQITFAGGVKGDGRGQTIAIVDAYDDPTIANDLHQFDVKFQLPDPTFTKVNQSGGTRLPVADSGWASEIALDVEWSHAIAPGANILLVEATDNSNANMFAAVTYAANRPGVVAVSMSWGEDEWSEDEKSSETLYDRTFVTPTGHTGVTFIASSGDSGAPPIYPAVSPNVLSVGGTTLNLDRQGNYFTEFGWAGSGGGISSFERQPAYQHGVVTQSSSFRTNPDVAYDADPYTGFPVYDSYSNFGWTVIGGTSAGAPQWAALIAIADQGLALEGLPSLDGPGQALPSLYNMPASSFHDIKAGWSFGDPLYSAGPGYDLVTGRGSPLANQVVAKLVAFAEQAAGGAVYVLGTDGNLWLERPGWLTTGRTWVDGNVLEFKMGSDGSVLVLGTDRNLWREKPGWLTTGRTWIDGNVLEFSQESDGWFLVLGTDRNLWREKAGWQTSGRTWVDGNVLEFKMGSDGSVLVLGTDRNLWREKPGWQTSGRTWVDGNVLAFAQ